MFFVHTSLVLMFSLQRQAGVAIGWRDYLAFMLRRCFRRLPLSTLVIAVVVAFDLPVAHVHHGQFSPEHPGAAGILADVLLVQNITGTESDLDLLRAARQLAGRDSLGWLLAGGGDRARGALSPGRGAAHSRRQPARRGFKRPAGPAPPTTRC